MGRIISANSVRTDALYYRNILLLHSINLQLMRSSVFSTLPSHPHREKRKNRDKMRSSIHPFIHSSIHHFNAMHSIPHYAFFFFISFVSPFRSQTFHIQTTESPAASISYIFQAQISSKIPHWLSISGFEYQSCLGHGESVLFRFPNKPMFVSGSKIKFHRVSFDLLLSHLLFLALL